MSCRDPKWKPKVGEVYSFLHFDVASCTYMPRRSVWGNTIEDFNILQKRNGISLSMEDEKIAEAARRNSKMEFKPAIGEPYWKIFYGAGKWMVSRSHDGWEANDLELNWLQKGMIKSTKEQAISSANLRNQQLKQ